MSPTGVDHVLLTRFNLPTPGVEGLIRAREGWLTERADLFERYCASSVARQTTPFTWIVYVDPESPGWLFDRLRPYVDRGLLRAVLRTEVGPAELAEDLAAAVPRPGSHLLTTNLDNDDGLATDFLARLRTVAPLPAARAVYLTRGLVLGPGGLYLRTDPDNAFCSVLEPWSGARTSWSERHNEFAQVMPVVRLHGSPAWLQVVHGSNVSNRVRGRLVAPDAYRAQFGSLLDEAPVPSTGLRVTDAVLRQPWRLLRDGARTALRETGLRVLGREGYESMKHRLRVIRTGA
ncbi:Putative rhamnosyl transferase [Microlunatus sagamiharensis]|uniref:Putative rhamnosyl transferase n=1 Tax=Microlunatus sagamiharensis TaxID=546874 RepID=A0A1H2LTV5_9ACTN|nr:glycosyltransferase [Microlunatus sagamiharensis]SDU84292.1 Putative rhamnosyl transferase [Microlunatus sagamiharensis]